MRLAVDSSALIAIAINEPERDSIIQVIETSAECYCSAATIYETGIVLLRRKFTTKHTYATGLATRMRIQVVAFTEEQALLALDAYRRYGKGMGSRPNLNLGDCISYALAKSLGIPLLFKGNDFPTTDIIPVL